jgi:beta-glucosidase
VSFHLPVDQLAFFNPELELVIESGKIEVMLGSSSQDIRLNGEFEISADSRLATRDRVFNCPVEIQ